MEQKKFCPRPGRRLLTAEQEAFFIENQYGLARAEIAQLMNETFGLQLTVIQIKEQRKRLKLTGGPAKLYFCRTKTSAGQFKKDGYRITTYLLALR